MFTSIPTASESLMTAALDAFGSPMDRSVRGSERKRKWLMPDIQALAKYEKQNVVSLQDSAGCNCLSYVHVGGMKQSYQIVWKH